MWKLWVQVPQGQPITSGVSSSTGRAPDCDSGQCGFKSHLTPPCFCSLMVKPLIRIQDLQVQVLSEAPFDHFFASLSQLDRVRGFEPRCWGFESLGRHHAALVLTVKHTLCTAEFGVRFLGVAPW